MSEIQYKFINDFYIYYQSKLYNSENYGFDFSDMIYYANKYISVIKILENLNFEYLIIDEYQDISEDRYILAKQVSDKYCQSSSSRDDWQTIFSFAGSKIEYIYNFLYIFQQPNIWKYQKVYRNSKKLIEYTSKFIMENHQQIPKEIISTKENSSQLSI